MTTKAATANGISRTDTHYLSRIDDCLREIKAIHKDLARKRTEGRTVSAELSHKLERLNEREQYEREKLLLKVENTLLRFERLLPPPPDSKKRK